MSEINYKTFIGLFFKYLKHKNDLFTFMKKKMFFNDYEFFFINLKNLFFKPQQEISYKKSKETKKRILINCNKQINNNNKKLKKRKGTMKK